MFLSILLSVPDFLTRQLAEQILGIELVRRQESGDSLWGVTWLTHNFVSKLAVVLGHYVDAGLKMLKFTKVSYTEDFSEIRFLSK